MSRAVIAVEIQGARLAIDAAHVEEVLGSRPFTVLHGTAEALAGAMAWRGGAVAVLDLGRLTGRGRPLAPAEVRRRNAIVRASGVTAALPVDGVREAVEVSDDCVRPASGDRFCPWQVELDGERLPLVDVPSVIASFVGAPGAAV